MSSEAPRLKSEVNETVSSAGAISKGHPHPRRTPPTRTIFSVIPGVGSGGPVARIVRQGKPYRVIDITALLYSIPNTSHEAARLAAIQALVAIELTNRNELCLVASALYDVASVENSVASAAQEGLVQLLSAHLEYSEGVHLTLQAIRLWENTPSRASLCATLIDRLRHQLPPESGLISPSRSEFLETAYIFSQALITVAYRTQALKALCNQLEDASPTSAAKRRELAGITIAALRKLGATPAELTALKTLATTILARGTTSPTPQRTRTPVIQLRNIDLVTAQQAEQRRQFGLAVTIEIIKSLPLLGRQITADEFENALRFDFSSRSLLPANRFWPSTSEWNTIERALEYAEQHQSFSPLRLAAFAKILATRIKVEDPKDPRESKRRPDALPMESRIKVLAAVERIKDAHDISSEDIDILCTDLTARLLAPEFAQWTTVSLTAAQP